jgi:hypothetical protein
MKFLHSLQNQFVTLAIRAPERKPVSHPREQSLECSKARWKEEVEKIVGDRCAQEYSFPQLGQEQTEQQ